MPCAVTCCSSGNVNKVNGRETRDACHCCGFSCIGGQPEKTAVFVLCVVLCLGLCLCTRSIPYAALPTSDMSTGRSVIVEVPETDRHVALLEFHQQKTDATSTGFPNAIVVFCTRPVQVDKWSTCADVRHKTYMCGISIVILQHTAFARHGELHTLFYHQSKWDKCSEYSPMWSRLLHVCSLWRCTRVVGQCFQT